MLFDFLTYNKFKFRKWDKYSLQDRAWAFQKLEMIQARKLGRPVAQVIFREMDETMKGQFMPDKNIILMNKIFIEQDMLRFDGMFTLFHEGRHAFQHNVCFSGQELGLFSKARKWKRNFGGYISGYGGDEFAFYAMQPIERDANKYALQRLKQFRFRFYDDRYYNATINFEEKCFYDDKFRAKEELGVFYRHKIAKRQKEEYDRFNY